MILSSDIVTEFRGRSSQIHVYPLSFREFFAAVGGDKRDALPLYAFGWDALPSKSEGRPDSKKTIWHSYLMRYISRISLSARELNG